MRQLANSSTVERFRREGGVALPVTLVILIVMLVLAAAAAAVTVTGTHQSARDRSEARALAAADAGLRTTIFRLNRLRPQNRRCLEQDDSTGLVTLGGLTSDDWCKQEAETLSETLADGASYRAQISAGASQTNLCQATQQRKIVATGTAEGVTQRLITTVAAPQTGSAFHCAVIGLDQVNLGGKGRIYGNVGSNGPFIASASDASHQAGLCGDAYAASNSLGSNYSQLCGSPPNGNSSLADCGGPGEKFCISPVSENCNAGNHYRDTYDPSTEAGCNNDDKICPPTGYGSCPADGNRISASSYDCPATVDPAHPPSTTCWDPGTKVLVLKNGAQLTLTGNIYAFCSLQILTGTAANGKGASITIAPRSSGQTVIVLLSPEDEACGIDPTTSYREQLYVNSQGSTPGIINMNPDPTTLVMLARGSNAAGASTSNITLSQNLDKTSPTINDGIERWSNMVIRAPRSEITLEGDTRIFGAVWAKRVDVRGSGSDATGARVVWSDNVANLDAGGALGSSFELNDWTLCGPPPSVSSAELTSGCSQ